MDIFKNHLQRDPSVPHPRPQFKTKKQIDQFCAGRISSSERRLVCNNFSREVAQNLRDVVHIINQVAKPKLNEAEKQTIQNSAVTGMTSLFIGRLGIRINAKSIKKFFEKLSLWRKNKKEKKEKKSCSPTSPSLRKKANGEYLYAIYENGQAVTSLVIKIRNDRNKKGVYWLVDRVGKDKSCRKGEPTRLLTNLILLAKRTSRNSDLNPNYLTLSASAQPTPQGTPYRSDSDLIRFYKTAFRLANAECEIRGKRITVKLR